MMKTMPIKTISRFSIIVVGSLLFLGAVDVGYAWGDHTWPIPPATCPAMPDTTQINVIKPCSSETVPIYQILGRLLLISLEKETTNSTFFRLIEHKEKSYEKRR